MPHLVWDETEIRQGQPRIKRADEPKQAVPYRLLVEDESLRVQGATGLNDNLLIQGDNLEALQSLLPYYAGQVKCVYIDPPFNTKQAFEHYDDGIEHSIWLSLMKIRLGLLKKLLALDGTIFIHIDDNELGYLIALGDEVLGRRNRVAVVTFKQGAATGHKAINPGMVSTTNFIVVYARSKEHWAPNRLYTGRERDKRYNQFVLNPEDSPANWKVTTLSKMFCGSYGRTLAELKKELGPLQVEEKLNDFVIAHAQHVHRTARPDYDDVSDDARKAIDESKAKPKQVILLKRSEHLDMYFRAGERLIFYREKLKEVDGVLVAGEPLTTLWDDLLSNNLHKEGDVSFPKGKKPEALIKRCIDLTTNPNDLILDSFLGSGTTAAVAHKMGRRWIGIEMGAHARTHCLPRLQKVVAGEQGGVSLGLNWQGGGGFRYYTLGAPIRDAAGHINPAVRFNELAAHLWFAETGAPWTGQPQKSPLIGVHHDTAKNQHTAYALFYNGVWGEDCPDNTLSPARLAKLKAKLPDFAGQWVIYAHFVKQLSEARLAREGIRFCQLPHGVVGAGR